MSDDYDIEILGQKIKYPNTWQASATIITSVIVISVAIYFATDCFIKTAHQNDPKLFVVV